MATSMYSADGDSNDELWRECTSWLIQLEMLRPDHKANWPQSSIADLANILRDGVLLCRLLNRIDPGCIDMKDVDLKPSMAQFLCLRNIQQFLHTCEISFGLSKNDLFEASMLFDLSNFHRVLCTLSKLSLSPKALRYNQPGFQAQKFATNEDGEIYQRLKSVDTRCMSGGPDGPHGSSSGCEPSWLNFTIPCPRPEDNEEEVYDDLCYVTFSAYMPEQQQTYEKRDYVIRELLDTEKNYVDVLMTLEKNFKAPLSRVMTTSTYECVFYKITELLEIHQKFYNDLNATRAEASPRFSAIFMKWREEFLIYGSYCANLTKATTTLQEMCDNDSNFNDIILRQEEAANNGKFKLRDVLSVPMQRILKYHLLLEKMIENTDPNDEEYKELRRAREAMLDVAGYINEAARDSEHLAVINKLQSNIVDWHHDPKMKLSDYGRLIRDSELRIRAHDDQKIRCRYVFIFEKAMLICKELKNRQFAFRDIIIISDYRIEDPHQRAVLNKDGRWSYNFMLVKNGNHTAFSISARTLEIKTQIIRAINEALEETYLCTKRMTNHQLEKRTFTTPTTCEHCSKYLKGLIYQGYQCKNCKIAVHKECCSNAVRCPPAPPAQSTVQSNSMLNNSAANTNGGGSGNGTGSWYQPMIEDNLWFVGEMDRTTATDKLFGRENGTFLVRIRPQNDDNDKYALTLKTDDTVKHMKICCNNNVPNYEQKYYLSRTKFFNSIVELVLNYQKHSLKENFERLDTTLLWPYRQIYAIVLRNFDAYTSSELSLREGETIIVIGKDGYRDAWWKGRKENSVGYFPASYVREGSEVNFD